MTRTIISVEDARFIGKVYKDGKLVLDWAELLPKEKQDWETIALCYDKKSGLAWVESATVEEELEAMSYSFTK